VKHISLVARRYWPAGEGQAMGLDDCFAIWQNMAVLVVVLQRCVL
jgi:hypothetical protein